MRRLVPCLVMALAACPAAEGPSLTSVVPNEVPSDRASVVTVHGSNLMPRVVVNFDRPSQSTIEPHFVVALENGPALELVETHGTTSLEVRVPGGTAPGAYALTLVDGQGRTARLESALTVTRCEGCDDAGRPSDGGDDGGADAGEPDGGRDAGCPLSWPDDDGDGFGAVGPPTAKCPVPAGHVLQGGDCRVFDARAFPGAREVCNGLDDDCSGKADEGVCPADAGWRVVASAAGAEDWTTVAAWRRGHVWIASRQGAVRVAQNGPFVDVSLGCTQRWTTSWADPETGRLFLGGGQGTGNGAAATHRPDAGGCEDPRDPGGELAGVVGFRTDGGLVVTGITRDRARYEWRYPTMAQRLPANFPPGSQLRDLHGQAPDDLLAVGADPGDARALAWRLQSDGGWLDDGLASAPGLPSTGVLSTWAAPGGLAWAVGQGGLGAERANGTWRALPKPDGGGEALRSVVGFARGRALACDAVGRVWRWEGDAWFLLHQPSTPFSCFDLAAVDEDDVWVVGTNGVVLHWPD